MAEQQEQALRRQRFQEIVRYAMEINTQNDRRFSQRDLADKLKVAPTMVTRYLQGRVEFWSMKAITLELLAKSCDLDVGSLYVWIQEGRAKALEHQERIESEPSMTRAEDLIKRALVMLENEKKPPGQKSLRYEALKRALDDLKGSAGELMFERMVALADAKAALSAVERGGELDSAGASKLAALLGIETEQLEKLLTDQAI